MKTLIQINTVCNTSTGKLMGYIQRRAEEDGYRTLSIVGRRKVFTDVPCKKIGNAVSFWIHVMVNTIFDRQGFGSWFMTRKIVKTLRQEKPDIIHLHNLHGYYLNLPVLFDYLSKEYSGKIFWTFHDCWPFTGHCAFFTAAKCSKWQKECQKCANKKEYPISLFMDSSCRNYEDKKRMFCSLKNLTIIVPSEWMAQHVRRSFLITYPLVVVNNGIDLKLFAYKKEGEKIFDRYNIDRRKKILLGVASVWDKRKGMNDFLNLARVLPFEYQIVLVGVSKTQKRKLPNNVTGIERTENAEELVSFYSMSHIFINPSLEESFSLVTVEAIACGTPVIVLDTSAVRELVCSDNGIVLGNHDASDYMNAIVEVEKKGLSREKVMRTAQKYNVEIFTEKVIQLYAQV